LIALPLSLQLAFIDRWLQTNPLATLALVILVLALAGRSFVNGQASNIKGLIESTIRLSDSVTRLEVLYRIKVLGLENKIDELSADVKHIRSHILNIETKIDIKEEDKINANDN
jgi:hypothetical protein